MNLKNNIDTIRQGLPEYCKLIAVSKNQPIEVIREAYEAGQRVFGENKVQELTEKYEALPKDIEWHMIGHLQSNKVKYLAPFVHLIHSVDSFKLLTEIDKQARKAGRVIPCLLQIFIADEETKWGFSEDEIRELLKTNAFDALHNVRITGLMGMATFSPDEQKVRGEFRGLHKFFDELKAGPLPVNFEMTDLSIGMSGDYRIAVGEGSTMVRIGTAIFGERKTVEL